MQVDTQDRFYNEILDMSTKNSSAYNTLFSKERIATLIGGVQQTKDAKLFTTMKVNILPSE
jgi:hypothetical protein